jgi:acetylornithine deacetylase/succinyl-diaminopimelate desuccinylase-like protein
MGRVPFDEQAWLAGPAASRATTGEEGFTTLERTGARPTAEVNGMWGGYTGPGHKTIIPAEAHAKVTFRLVADQRPEDVAAQVRAWVEANLPEGIEADVHAPPGGVAPCASDLDSPAMDALLRAIAQAFDTEPDAVLFTREGGSGPEADLVEVLGAPLLFLGAGLPTDRIHSPNERVLLPMLYRGAEAAAHLWRELGAGSAG